MGSRLPVAFRSIPVRKFQAANETKVILEWVYEMNKFKMLSYFFFFRKFIATLRTMQNLATNGWTFRRIVLVS